MNSPSWTGTTIRALSINTVFVRCWATWTLEGSLNLTKQTRVAVPRWTMGSLKNSHMQKTHEFVSSCVEWILLACPELYCDWSLHNQHSWNVSGVHGFLSLTVRFLRKNQPFFQREMVILARHLSDIYKAPLPKSPRIHSQRQEVYPVKWHITKQPIEGSKLPPPPHPVSTYRNGPG